MSIHSRNSIVKALAETLDIPDSAYEKAGDRYKDLGSWFDSSSAECSAFSPRIYSQGSFRLGTAIRPLTDDEGYDLDVGCRLEAGVSKASHTQEQLKLMVGRDVERYRIARRVQAEKEEKHRCWRLMYADVLNFHMDIVPSIPETGTQYQAVKAAMFRSGLDVSLVERVAAHSGSITDNKHPLYRAICHEWRVSNSEGYAQWFESRMKLAKPVLEKRAFEMKATVEDLPVYKWRTPLQRCVQILKRHRNVMYKDNPDLGPISVIITTISARAYQGEVEIGDALRQILDNMGRLVSDNKPRVPNPVNPAEDFADKWDTAEGRSKRLEQNFWVWLQQAQSDFESLTGSTDSDFIAIQARQKFGSTLSPATVRQALGEHYASVTVAPKSPVIITDPAKPWREN